MAQLLYLDAGRTLKLDRERCAGCGRCEEVCPHAVVRVNGGKAAIVNRDACMECGACAMNCPTGAVSVERGTGCAALAIRSALGRRSGQGKPACGESRRCSGGC